MSYPYTLSGDTVLGFGVCERPVLGGGVVVGTVPCGVARDCR